MKIKIAYFIYRIFSKILCFLTKFCNKLSVLISKVSYYLTNTHFGGDDNV